MGYGKDIKVKVVGDGYEVLEDYTYISTTYGHSLLIEKGFYSDGATCARDLENTDAWLIHDHICRYGEWSDGTKIVNWVASGVLADELWKDGYRWEAFWWFWATYFRGGGAARINGMRRLG